MSALRREEAHLHASPREPLSLFELNPQVDRQEYARRFAGAGRVQVVDVLTEDAASNLYDVLSRSTPWGLAWQSGSGGPQALRSHELERTPAQTRNLISHSIVESARKGEFAFAYNRYPIVDAYLDGWAPDSPHDVLLEHLNCEPFLQLARDITGLSDLVKADAQATLFGPNHFLGLHDDSHVQEGWKVAYVLNLCPVDWRPEWGGYLLFHDEMGDVLAGFKPRFNVLNLFAVPQQHSVSLVAGFAPVERYSITGWLRDK